MNRRRLDVLIKAHETIAVADAAIIRAQSRKSRLRWLESLHRSGHPLPDTPEGLAETERIYEEPDRGNVPAGMLNRTRGMDWDGIWRNQ